MQGVVYNPKSVLGDREIVIDSSPTENSSNAVSSGGVYTALAGKQSTLTFDNSPTQNSDNPVKSGGVYSALSGKQATLTFDTSPTQDSTNPVTSGGVYTALSEKSNTGHKHAAGDITSGTLGVARGGTGASSLTSGSYLVGNGTGAVSLKTPSQVLTDIGAASLTDTNDAKTALANAIVSKGGTATSSQTFAQLATAIGDIPVGSTVTVKTASVSSSTSISFTNCSETITASKSMCVCYNTNKTHGSSYIVSGTYGTILEYFYDSSQTSKNLVSNYATVSITQSGTTVKITSGSSYRFNGTYALVYWT